jgi:quinoprotein glucose dehydrogenase
MRVSSFAGFGLVLCVVGWPAAFAQSGAKQGEWRTYGGDSGNTRYSPLDQIDAANFNRLELAWRFKTDNLGPRPEYNLEGTPLMANGMVFATAGSRRDVVALDAATGELLWVHRENEGERGRHAPRPLSGRGLAYWTDDRQERIYYVTPGYRLIALNAKNGALIAGFGTDGVVDLKQDDDQVMDPINSDIGLASAPTVANDVILIGAAHLSSGVPRSKRNVKGYVRGFDVRSGKRLWIFHTIPKPGEFGYDTWQGDSADYTGNTGVWGQISVDEQSGTAYLPVELPTGDYYGGHRPGNGLFGESIVAIDVKTGVRKWHYQLVHHGLWDFDIPCAPMLLDITMDGRAVKALAQPTKQAFLYLFDRVTGQPLFPMEERPVEQSTVPGEKTSPTQPFPTKPPPYDTQGFTANDLIDYTPELRKQAEALVARYKLGPIFTPPVLSQANGPLATLGLAGGTNWPGGAVDPETGIAYVFSQKFLLRMGLIPGDRSKTDFAYVQGTAVGGAGPPPALNVQNLPLYKPPYGSITAVWVAEGKNLWQIAHGETPDVVRNHPALKGLNIPRTGRAGIGMGMLVTKTLLIAGESGTITMPDGKPGAYLRAYDKATGQDAGMVAMPAGETGSPMTYMFNGKQYIVVPVSAPGFPGEYLAYRLPD